MCEIVPDNVELVLTGLESFEEETVGFGTPLENVLLLTCDRPRGAFWPLGRIPLSCKLCEEIGWLAGSLVVSGEEPGDCSWAESRELGELSCEIGLICSPALAIPLT